MWERIKSILQKEGGKCIIVEKEGPAYVVVKLEEYEAGKHSGVKKGQEDENSAIEKVNQDLARWEAGERKNQEETAAEGEIKVEDLPF